MKITNKIISEVVGDLLGEEALNILLYIKGKEKVSEFTVAKEMKLDVHHARAIIYKLFEINLAVFERRKDRQKGWYVTYWDFFPDNVPHIYAKIQKSKLEKLKEKLDKEQGSDFYMCKNACTRMDFDKTSEFNYKCPECGELMNPMDNKRTIEFINEKIDDLKKEIAQE
jgi:transcription initiation factor TFIIE subunit alpha